MPKKIKASAPQNSFVRQLPKSAVTNMLVRSGMLPGGNGTNNPPAYNHHNHLPVYMQSELDAKRTLRAKRIEEALKRKLI